MFIWALTPMILMSFLFCLKLLLVKESSVKSFSFHIINFSLCVFLLQIIVRPMLRTRLPFRKGTNLKTHRLNVGSLSIKKWQRKRAVSWGPIVKQLSFCYENMSKDSHDNAGFMKTFTQLIIDSTAVDMRWKGLSKRRHQR